jgi:ATP-dependent Clp protease protease subunit
MKTKLKPYFAAAVKADGVLELTVYEEIGSDWFGEGITAKSVKQELDRAGSFNRISIRINSPGGDAFEGIAIHSLLRAQKKPIDVYVDGIAASAASIIAMAGDTCTMGHGAMQMIHNAWSLCIGDGSDMRKMGDTLDRVSESIAQVFADRTGKSLQDVKALMDAETWMGADECVKEGFATGIASDADGDEAAMAMASRFRSLAKLKNVPEKLKAAATAGPDEDKKPPEVPAPEVPVEVPAAEVEPAAAVEESNLSQYEARLKMLRAA